MFQELLHILMEEREVTQSELSKTTGISKSSISQYLSGKNKPSEKRLNLLADTLGCSVDYFYHDLPMNQALNPNSLNLAKVSVENAAKRIGKSKQFVRVALQQGIAPFGFAVKISANRWTYYISPKNLNCTSKECDRDVTSKENSPLNM